MNPSDLPEQLDLSFGDGPAHRPVDARLKAGHRALARRRAMTGLASFAVIAVVGTTFTLAAGGGGPSASSIDPGASSSQEPSPDQPQTPTIRTEPTSSRRRATRWR